EHCPVTPRYRGTQSIRGPGQVSRRLRSAAIGAVQTQGALSSATPVIVPSRLCNNAVTVNRKVADWPAGTVPRLPVGEKQCVAPRTTSVTVAPSTLMFRLTPVSPAPTTPQ